MIYDADTSLRQSEPYNEPESLPGYVFFLAQYPRERKARHTPSFYWNRTLY